jgi:hypothetical protein
MYSQIGSAPHLQRGREISLSPEAEVGNTPNLSGDGECSLSPESLGMPHTSLLLGSARSLAEDWECSLSPWALGVPPFPRRWGGLPKSMETFGSFSIGNLLWNHATNTVTLSNSVPDFQARCGDSLVEGQCKSRPRRGFRNYLRR